MACDCEEDRQSVVHDWPEGFAGKSLAGFNVTVTDPNGLSTLTDVVIAFYDNPDFTGTAVISLTVGDGLTITSASDPWVIAIATISEAPAAGVYFYQMVTTESGVGDWPYMTGKWRVNPSI